MAVFTGWILVLIGLALTGGGGWLAVLGGSWYYLLAGLGFLLTGALMVLRRPGALWIYALLILGTGLWSVWEVGLDWWALMPRGVVIVAIGLWLMTPWVTRGLNASGRQPWGLAAGPVAVMVVAAGALALTAVLGPDPNGVRGELPTARAPQPPQSSQSNIPDGDWHAYGRTGFGQRYSPLDQITPDNADRLEPIWTYHTGDLRGEGDPVETTYEVTPLKIDNTLYLCTPHHWVIALDADSGEEIWKFDPQIDKDISRQHQTCRGLSYFDGHQQAEPLAPGEDSAVAASGERDSSAYPTCQRRLFLPTGDARLIALDPETGERCAGFGDNGSVNLWANMPHQQDGFYYSTSPPVVTE
ncbi:MAG: membrane-bound PQQ-dependent dehydrogenase, glucose/quinate/shikimate family, partial [Alloalcanivorax venustensis]